MPQPDPMRTSCSAAPAYERAVGGRFFGSVFARLSNAYGELDCAQPELERARDGKGQIVQARVNLGFARSPADRLNEAGDACEECRSHDPASPRVRVCLLHLDDAETGSPG